MAAKIANERGLSEKVKFIELDAEKMGDFFSPQSVDGMLHLQHHLTPTTLPLTPQHQLHSERSCQLRANIILQLYGFQRRCHISQTNHCFSKMQLVFLIMTALFCLVQCSVVQCSTVYSIM